MTLTSGIDFQRVTTRAQLERYLRCVAVGFQSSYEPNDGWLDAIVAQLGSLDYRIAVDRGDAVGTFVSFDQYLTAVGGAPLGVRAISGVTVLPTHRRRGILNAHMRACLDSARASGAAAATLIAAEYGIYGRYGFGPSTTCVDYQIAVDPAARPAPPVDEARFVSGEQYYAAFTSLHSRLDHPGGASRLDLRVRRSAGLYDEKAKEQPHRVELRRAGEVVGLLSYTVEMNWTQARPASTLTIRELLGVDPAAERDLWALAMSVDWVRTVSASQRPLDDVVRDVAPDPRAVQMSNLTDFLWIRPLDVPTMFSARTYAAPGRLVLDIADPGYDGDGPGPANGRFLVESGGGPGTCTRTDEPADLALDVQSLGRLWLYGEPISRRVAVGEIRELRDGAAARADLLLFSPRRPWTDEIF